MGNIQNINARFKEAVEILIKSRDARNKTAIADALNIGKSKFSEILHFRMNVGLELISDFCDVYNISLDWILYERGEMIKKNEIQNIGDEKDRYIIELQKEKIDQLEKKVKRLKKDLEPPHGYRTVAEKDS